MRKNVAITALHRISDQVWLAGQISVEEIGELAKAEFTVVVNHRPDGEEPAQPPAAEIAKRAEAAGLRAVHAPVRGLPDARSVALTLAALESMGPDDKAVMFCRSGMRSAAAWAMAERSRGAKAQDLRDAAAAAGYNLDRVPL